MQLKLWLPGIETEQQTKQLWNDLERNVQEQVVHKLAKVMIKMLSQKAASQEPNAPVEDEFNGKQ